MLDNGDGLPPDRLMALNRGVGLENTRARLEQLYAQRDPLYREIADIIVDTGSQSLGALANKLERRLLEFKARTGGPEDSPGRAG